jgi:cystathionine beta-synthase
MTFVPSNFSYPHPAPDVLHLIGNTPMVRVRHIDTGMCELYLKLESHNPGGSIKDRIALSMIEAAEREGLISAGGTLVEATAGNTGLGLALVAGQKGYKLTLVIPDKMSQEKIFHLKALGAEVIITRSDVGKGDPEYYQDMAERIARETPNAFYVNQFANPHNPLTHERTTGPEILAQMGGDLDAMVVGVGSGGTLTGLGRYFAAHSPKTKMILADPKGSILAPLVNEGITIEAGSWMVEGIGEDFVPDNCDLSLVAEAHTITDAESIATARELLQKEGIICGSSSGTLIAAALRYCRAQTTPKRVVTFVCDSGNKYLSKIYNEYWLDDHGFVAREQEHSLRDLIIRPYRKGSAITVNPGDTLQAAYRKMKMYDVSQLPVMQRQQGRETLVGIIDETDILLAICGNPAGFAIKVAQAMTRELTTLQVTAAPEDLLPIFKAGMVAIVMEKEEFLGIITPIDFLQYIRRRVGHG